MCVGVYYLGRLLQTLSHRVMTKVITSLSAILFIRHCCSGSFDETRVFYGDKKFHIQITHLSRNQSITPPKAIVSQIRLSEP